MKTSWKIIIALAVCTATVFAAEEMKWPWPVRDKAEIETILAKAPKADAKQKFRPLNIVLVAGPKDHGPNEHDYPLWQKKWKRLLDGSGKMWIQIYPPPASARAIGNVKVTEANEWPSREQLKTANVIVMNSWGRWNDQKLQDLDEFLSKGGGFVSVHPALITNKQYSEKLTKLLGLAWEHKYTWYRYGPMKLKIQAPDDPICLGLPKEIDFVDEAYWPLKGNVNNVKVLATSDEKNAKDPNIIKAEPMFWKYQHGRGRVFACILGHYDRTFDDPYLRILLLRGIAWAAGEWPYRFDPVVLTSSHRD